MSVPDAHCHLDQLPDPGEAVRRARAAGVSPVLAVSEDATGLEAVRLGGVIYIAPFFFVLNPALIGQAPAGEVIVALSGALVGVWFISSALQGHVSLIGDLGGGALGMALRALLFAGGVLLALPGGEATGYSHLSLALAGAALAVIPLIAARARGNAARKAPVA